MPTDAAELTVTQPTFHAAEGWHWLRLEDGSVRLEHRIDLEGNADAAVTLEPSSWASVVAFVSARGETARTYALAVAFHEGQDDELEAKLEEAAVELHRQAARIAELELELENAEESGILHAHRLLED